MSYFMLGTLLLLVNLVSSNECPGCSVYDNLIESFNDTAVTDFVLTESGNTSKLLDCVVMCYRDIRCRSYRHNVLTETCSTYGVGYSLPENTFNTVTAEAGSRLYAMCGMSKSFGSSCSVDGGCDFANSTCLSGTCSCKLGFSYDVWTGFCLVRCSTYSNWFTFHPQTGVSGCNNKLVSGLTQQRCMEACRDELAFTCINAEYDTQHCYMCDTTWFDLDPSQRRNGNGVGWVLYYRHCGY